MGRAQHVLACLAAAALLAQASVASADEPARPRVHDPGVFPPRGTGTELTVGGLGITAFWYGSAVGFSYLWPEAPGANDLRVPVAGPWMALADTGCAETNPGCGAFGIVLRAILTTIDAVGQTGGVLVAAEGVFLRTRNATGPERKGLPQPRREASPEVSAAPFFSGDAAGMGLVGRF